MKGRQIILDHVNDIECAALMVDGQLQDLLIDSDDLRPGTILRAVADRPIKGMGGVMLSGPDGPLFLRQAKGIAPGDRLLVQVATYAEPGKAQPVNTKILFKSRYAIVTPDAPGLNISRSIRDDDRRDTLQIIAKATMDGIDMGLILRSACLDADDEDITDDISAMVDLAQAVLADTGNDPEILSDGDGPHSIAWREWTDPADIHTDPGGFEALGVLDAMEDLRSPDSPLPGGGSLCVEPTRALVAVDVNTGRNTSFAAGQKTNLAAAADLPRQLRLRGLGGQIVLDPAPMTKKDRRSFETALRAAFRRDDVETSLVGWTSLGLYELQRKRARLPVADQLEKLLS